MLHICAHLCSPGMKKCTPIYKLTWMFQMQLTQLIKFRLETVTTHLDDYIGIFMAFERYVNREYWGEESNVPIAAPRHFTDVGVLFLDNYRYFTVSVSPNVVLGLLTLECACAIFDGALSMESTLNSVKCRVIDFRLDCWGSEKKVLIIFYLFLVYS